MLKVGELRVMVKGVGYQGLKFLVKKLIEPWKFFPNGQVEILWEDGRTSREPRELIKDWSKPL